MSIASEITRLQGVKSDILQAISGKGVTVPSGSALDDCPGLITDIPTGGGDYGTLVLGGVIYPTKKIGNLIWLCQNLQWIPDSIRNDWTNTNDYPCAMEYGGNQGIAYMRGLFYNQKAILKLNEILPDGWRVANDSDWVSLFNQLGGQSVCAKKMMPSFQPMLGTNESNFDLYPVGYKNGSNNTGSDSYVKIATPQNNGTYSTSFLWRNGQANVENGTTAMSNGGTVLRICKDV